MLFGQLNMQHCVLKGIYVALIIICISGRWAVLKGHTKTTLIWTAHWKVALAIPPTVFQTVFQFFHDRFFHFYRSVLFYCGPFFPQFPFLTLIVMISPILYSATSVWQSLRSLPVSSLRNVIAALDGLGSTAIIICLLSKRRYFEASDENQK